MPDIPLKETKKAIEEQTPGNKIEVTHENADLLMVHFLSQIYSRLGYMIKLLEDK